MTNVIFKRKEFEKQIKLNPEIIEKISLFGTPLERIDNDEIEIEIFPNRPDLISIQGYMRAFRAFLGKETGIKKYRLNKPKKEFRVFVDKDVKDVRPYTVCAVVENINLDDDRIKSIIDMQEKLHITLGRNRKKVAIGIYPLNKIKFPIKYTALKPTEIKFIPLESKNIMTGIQILQKHPAGKKYSALLKGAKKYPVFIDAENKILSMPPIINSNETGRVSQMTKSIFIECSGDNPEVLNKTLSIITTAILEMGGTGFQVKIQDGKISETPDLSPQETKISLENVNKILGLNLKQDEIKNLLAKMGHDYKNQRVFTPQWRTDVLHEIDLIEDIAIAYGYDKINPEIPNISTIGEEDKTEIIKEAISNSLIGLNFIEISTYHLIKENEAKKMKLKKYLELEDSKTEYKILRPSLLIPCLRIISENTDAEYPQKIFEIGKIFSHSNYKETKVKEEESLIIAISSGNFTEIKQHIEYVFRMFDVKYDLEESSHFGLINGRTGEIIVSGKKIGYMGEVHPKTLNDWNIKMPVAIAEIKLEEIYKILANQPK